MDCVIFKMPDVRQPQRLLFVRMTANYRIDRRWSVGVVLMLCWNVRNLVKDFFKDI